MAQNQYRSKRRPMRRQRRNYSRGRSSMRRRRMRTRSNAGGKMGAFKTWFFVLVGVLTFGMVKLGWSKSILELFGDKTPTKPTA